MLNRTISKSFLATLIVSLATYCNPRSKKSASAVTRIVDAMQFGVNAREYVIRTIVVELCESVIPQSELFAEVEAVAERRNLSARTVSNYIGYSKKVFAHACGDAKQQRLANRFARGESFFKVFEESKIVAKAKRSTKSAPRKEATARGVLAMLATMSKAERSKAVSAILRKYVH